MVTGIGRDRFDAHGEFLPARQRESQVPHQFGSSGEPLVHGDPGLPAEPDGPPASHRVSVQPGDPRAPGFRRWPGYSCQHGGEPIGGDRQVQPGGERHRRWGHSGVESSGRRIGLLPGPTAAMADRYAVRVGDRDADPAVRADGGEFRELTAQLRVEDAEPVPFAWAVRAAKQGGQWENQFRQDRAACWLSSVPRSDAACLRLRRAFPAVARGTTGAAAGTWPPGGRRQDCHRRVHRHPDVIAGSAAGVSALRWPSAMRMSAVRPLIRSR